MRHLRRVPLTLKVPAAALLAGAAVTAYPAQAVNADASSTAFNQLFGVAASSSRNAWVVGVSISGPGFHAHTLIGRWNGRRWTRVRSPNPAGPVSDIQMTGVAAPTATRAWAVGWTLTNAGAQTLIERWNGRAWTIQKSPNVGTGDNHLEGVSATSALRAWAVGDYSNSAGDEHVLIERWNGRTWRPLAIPNPKKVGVAGLTGVAATSPSNAWAVGSYASPESGSFGLLTLIEHWNGRTWKVVPSPNPGGINNFNELNAVAAASPARAWAVGRLTSTRTGLTKPIIEHWNGRRWKLDAIPNPGTSNTLLGVAATSPTNAWAVGGYAIGSGHDHTLIEHWNGKAWRRVPSPSPGGTNSSDLFSVTAISRASAWAIGYYTKGTAVLTLIEHWNGRTWKQVTSPNPTH